MADSSENDMDNEDGWDEYPDVRICLCFIFVAVGLYVLAGV
jgi:hypothetical protein